MIPAVPWVRSVTMRGLWLVAAVALVTAGCQSSQGWISNCIASVMVENRSREQIVAAMNEVFREHSYQTMLQGPDDYVFEKKSGGVNTVLYGGLLVESVWVRVKVNLHERTPSETLVECDAYIVREHGNSFFEGDQKLPKFREGPYQQLLDQIKRRLH